MPWLRSMPSLFVVLLGVLLVVLLGAAVLPAQQPLRVLTRDTPPFAMQTDTGWSGLAIDLWRDVAAAEQLEFAYRDTALPELLQRMGDGTADVAAAAVTVTAAREQAFDFCHPFLESGIGIATRSVGDGIWLRVFAKLVSEDFLSALLALATVLLICGLLVWLFERRANPEQFGGRGLRGIGAGFWFSAVTMTTVGYGDKAPATLGGRLVALVWMFASIIVISSYTAAIASSLTADNLATIQGAQDLPGRRIASVPESSSAEWLREHGLPFTPAETAAAAMQRLADGSVDAVVYDAPLLRYLVRQGAGGTGSDRKGKAVVLPDLVRRESYAFAVPTGSPLRERINRRVLEALATPDWQRRVTSYLGD
ncbi:MAG: transporter substrate-binding domain-containing protein [Planctomycetota bacterium]